jgi:hypothetical protein
MPYICYDFRFLFIHPRLLHPRLRACLALSEKAALSGAGVTVVFSKPVLAYRSPERRVSRTLGGCHRQEQFCKRVGNQDPFDRILVAQALAEPTRLITHDPLVALYRDTIIKIARTAGQTTSSSFWPDAG